MSRGIHLVSNNIPGYESSEGRCLPCWGASGRAAAASSYSCCGDHKPFLQVKVLSMKSPVYASKRVSLSCNASSSSQRRIPDFSRQDTHGFSRASKKQNQEGDSSENLEESEMLSSKNGPLLSLASSPKFQATATPGPREKEIVELFRKVQAQLRERAAIKENKNEALHRQGRESETVDDLLKLLRKHSVEQGKRRSNGGSRDFSVDQSEKNTLCGEDQNTSFFDSNSIVRDEQRELNAGFIRPASNFQRKSPVSRVKYQHIYSTKSGISLNSSSKSLWRRKVSMAKPLPEPKPEPETQPKLEPESFFLDGQGVMNVMSEPELETLRKPEPEPFFLDGQEVMNVMSEPEPETQREPEPEPEPFCLDGQEVMNVMSESETSDIDEAYDNETVEEPSSTEERDCSALKLSELRVLAKSRGVKGYSKLKKRELLGLLSGDTA